MSIEDQLKQLIVEKYGSVRAFTKSINVPYSTIDSMLKRGINGTGVATVLLVCLSLQIDIEELLQGRVTRKETALDETKKTPLYSSEAEKFALDYDALDSYGKQVVRLVLDAEKVRCAEQAQSSKVIKIAARDGHFTEIRLTDDQIKDLQAHIDQLPDPSDDL